MTERRRIYRLPWSYPSGDDLDILPAHEGFQPAVMAHDLQLGDTPLHAEGPILDIWWRQRRHLLYTCDPAAVPANNLDWRLGDPTWVGPFPAWTLVPLARLAEWDTPPVPPKVGDIITDAAVLETLPVGTVVRHRSWFNPICVKTGEGWSRTTGDRIWSSDELLDSAVRAVEIVWLPS